MDSFYGDFAFPQFTFLPPHVPVQVVIFANRLEVDCKNKNFNKRFSFFFSKDSRFVCDPAPARHSDLQPRYRE